VTALALQPGIREYIIAQVARGERLDDLGMGITRQSISEALQDDPEYQAAQVSYHAARLDRAESMLMAAEPPDVPRARAIHDAYKWRAEREMSRIWGAKQQTDINQAVTVVIALQDSAGRIIEGEARPVLHDQAHGPTDR
jgi:hypothetical protein